ncbi:MAG TPA: 2-C-methyl-D-erythritol 4-phosphate cytidylyltransferase [Pseudomonadales bacterium]|jgi:2-C-methyl-D-erythritol 4-phosphate cytidylyltransferase|nr:2-C-methyl-D-erythritol 4-phosphate cytidylyltransferase [Pseudomonadales bacterium]HMW15401.1 2-C-methyl-D-erythritol 4-phosphate cytidylyltransferase [Pseudomonadales bacterium]HMW83527.1 2-C-methyl-D-erythritol 4-phosphate cytidylyltransferase [Pseudomonadales bacterium]HMZ71170.1 2-C-methyl-D-erythritol 4-phosphate cytidylyltransferase [Pseudomonadales bacterium]HMZ91810.1 2-C-methyl-D-erythritol 4-phosphate cytidylyltransferase [Pseudomonadales bacterium]
MSASPPTRSTTPLWAVVPAAGLGSRLGAELPKQYLPLLGRAMIEHTLERLLQLTEIQAIVVVLHPHDRWWPTLGLHDHPRITTVTGGAERCHSVLAGLRRLREQAAGHQRVLVHDAARPCVRPADIRTLIEQTTHHADGGLLGVAVRDTMKRLDETHQVQQTVSRTRLWHAQTPQLFTLEPLITALEQATTRQQLVTDEAEAMELIGHRPLLVAGSDDNIKVTRSEDLPLAEFHLQRQVAQFAREASA